MQGCSTQFYFFSKQFYVWKVETSVFSDTQKWKDNKLSNILNVKIKKGNKNEILYGI